MPRPRFAPPRSTGTRARALSFLAASALAATCARAQPTVERDDLSIRRVLATQPGARPVRLELDPLTGDLLVLRVDGTLEAVDPDAPAPEPVLIATAAETLPSPQGAAIAPDGTLFLAGNRAEGDHTVATVRRGRRDEAGAWTWDDFARTEPYPLGGRLFNHLFTGMVVAPDGRHLFVSSGSRTDHGEVADRDGLFPGVREVGLTAKLLRLPIGGDASAVITLPDDREALASAGYLWAEGLRNTFDLAFDDEDRLFGAENSGDRGDPEELNWIRAGRHYGFPWRMGENDTPMRFAGYDPDADPLLEPSYFATVNGLFYEDPDYPAPPAGVEFTDPVRNAGPDGDSFRDPETGEARDASDLGIAAPTFTPHRSPLGLVFDRAGALGGEYTGDGFVSSWTHGTPDADTRNGPFFDPSEDVLWLEMSPPDAAGRLTLRAVRIASGFTNPVDAVLDGPRLYLIEYGGEAAIWEITFPESEAPSPRFVRGDVNADGDRDLSDGVLTLLHLFAGASIACLDAADVDDDGAVELDDPVRLLRHLFSAEPPPAAPFPGCGVDASPDAGDADLGCATPPPSCG